MGQAPPLTHLIRLTDDVGVIQHAHLDVPNRNTGYCTDDVARAFIVALKSIEARAAAGEAERLAQIYLSFLLDAQLPGGKFLNFMGYDRRWLDDRQGSPDCNGRAVWALGFGVQHAARETWRELCDRAVLRWLPHLSGLTSIRARAFAMLGLAEVLRARPGDAAVREALREAAGVLARAYRENRADGWEWFEDYLVYDNARLSEALLRAGMALQDADLVEAGIRTLDFLEGIVFRDGTFVPIGNEGWYVRGLARAEFAQQPLEAAAMVDAEAAAYEATGDLGRYRSARRAFDWFLGRNVSGEVMVKDGGCFDGLDAGGVNRNMGAESTLAYLSGALTIAGMASEDVSDIGRVAR
jgi:hypothetical protein